MEDRTESWQLRSGTWRRDPKSERWRLAMTRSGTVVNEKLSPQDVGRMIGAKKDKSNGQWFPSDFNYSPHTGAVLHASIISPDTRWVPPFGASALAEITRPLARGLKPTPAPLTSARSNGRLDATSDADRTLPALPPGQYRFLVHEFDVTSPSLMAIDSEHGNLLLLLPESKIWIPLEPTGETLATGLRNSRGWRIEVVWRMEVVEAAGSATLYLPTVKGLAAVTPSLMGLSYAVAYFGEGVALGGPVAWAGEFWLPVLGRNGVVNLVGKPRGAAKPIFLPTRAPAPKNGFEAPVFHPRHAIWPSEEGQLVLRQNQSGNEETEWIAWPDGLSPMFSLGGAHLSLVGSLLQLCRRGQDESLEYVEMGKLLPERGAHDAPHIRNKEIAGQSWKGPDDILDAAPSELVIRLLESELERAAIGLRINAPRGVLALLESVEEKHRAVLQFQAANRPDVPFGTLCVARPWLASLFVYDACLWVYHPELPQALGWTLESHVEQGRSDSRLHVRGLTP